MAERLDELQSGYALFVAERDWERYHTPQNLATALSVESNELLGCFLWHDNVPAEQIKKDPQLMSDIEDEIADVVIYSLGLANQLDINLGARVTQKLDANEERFDDERAAEISEELDNWQRE